MRMMPKKEALGLAFICVGFLLTILSVAVTVYGSTPITTPVSWSEMDCYIEQARVLHLIQMVSLMGGMVFGVLGVGIYTVRG